MAPILREKPWEKEWTCFSEIYDFTHQEGFRNRYCRKSTTFVRGAPNGGFLDKSFGIDSLKLFLVTFFVIQLSESPRAKSSILQDTS